MIYANRGLETVEGRVLAQSLFPLKAGEKIPGRNLKDSDDEKFRERRAMLATVNSARLAGSASVHFMLLRASALAHS